MITEKDLEDAIWRMIEQDNYAGLCARGLYLNHTNFRQLDLGPYGIADLVSIDYDIGQRIYVKIIELKKDMVGYETLDQALKYVKGIEGLLSNYYIKKEIEITIQLIGKEIDKSSSFCYIPDFCESIELTTYRFDFQDGLAFTNESGYSLANGVAGRLNKKNKEVVKNMIRSKVNQKKFNVEEFIKSNNNATN